MRERIKKNFDKAAANQTYENAAFIQKKCAEQLVETFFRLTSEDEKINKVLDIGVGTGFTAEILLKKYPHAFYDLNDISDEMLKITSSKFANRNFSLICEDIEKIKLKNDYDLIISNFSFQWLENLPKFLEKIIQGKKTKYLIFTTLVDNNFQEIRDIFQEYGVKTINYPKSADLDCIIKPHNPETFFSEKKIYAMQFKNFYEYAQYMKNLGANFVDHGKEKLKQIILNENKEISLSYEVYFCFVEI